MKRVILVAFAIITLLSSCSATTADKNQQVTETASISAGQESDAQEDVLYEITAEKAEVWTDSIGTVWAQTIVEIENTGTKNLYLSSGSYDLEDSSGTLIAAETLVSEFPDVIAPGEKGYMYDETILENYDLDGAVIVNARPSVEEAKIDLIRYNVSDVSISDGEYGGIRVLGRVENQTDEVGSMIYIAAVFYGENSEPIGLAFTILTEDIPAGEKIGFEISGFSMPDDITTDRIANTIIYAYPSQMQF